jgi:photosystem II stability/assembly factor-like uncharacterized protein
MKAIIFTFLFILSITISCDILTDSLETSQGWYQQRMQQDDITYYAIFFSDENNGWIVGYDGTIQFSSDGGDTWVSQHSGVSSNLWDVCFISKDIGWVCGQNNTILKTTNGGKTWINLSPEDSNKKTYVAIKFIDDAVGWISNNNGEILKSTDGGFSWELKKKCESGGALLAVLNSNTIYALQRIQAYLYKTFDGGITWDSVKVSIPKYYAASDMSFPNVDNGWLSTWNVTAGMMIYEYPVIITNNGGTTWFSSDSLKDAELGFRCVYFINKNTGWVAGSDNVYKTRDGGKHWQLDFTASKDLSAEDMFFINEKCGWIISLDGAIFKYECY